MKLETTRPLTKEERTIIAIKAFEREFNNGGLLQFFQNSSREYAPEIVESLKIINCTKTAALVQNAINSLQIEGDITEDSIGGLMDTFENEVYESVQDVNFFKLMFGKQKKVDVKQQTIESELESIDDELFKSHEVIGDQLFEFIKDNRTKIIANL